MASLHHNCEACDDTKITIVLRVCLRGPREVSRVLIRHHAMFVCQSSQFVPGAALAYRCCFPGAMHRQFFAVGGAALRGNERCGHLRAGPQRRNVRQCLRATKGERRQVNKRNKSNSGCELQLCTVVVRKLAAGSSTFRLCFVCNGVHRYYLLSHL